MVSPKEMSEALKTFLNKYDFNPNDLNARSANRYKWIPLNFVINDKFLGNRLSIINELLQLGANPNLSRSSKSNLYTAITQDEPDIVELLCENGANIGFDEEAGVTPFETVMKESRHLVNKPRILKTLLRFGATVKYEEDKSEISAEELEKIYLRLYEIIVNEYKIAGNLKKKLIILIGEGHQLKMSLLVEIMVLNIAAQLGIFNLVLEANDEILQELSEQGTVTRKQGDFLVLESIYAVAKSLGMNFFAGDPEHGIVGDDSINIRDNAMSQYIRNVNFEKGAIFIIGSDHMRGLMEVHPIEESFHVLAINTYPLLDPSKERAWDLNISDIPFLKSPNLHQFYSCTGNPELYSDEDIRDTVNTVVRQCKTKQIIKEATGLGEQTDIVLSYSSENNLLPGYLLASGSAPKSRKEVANASVSVAADESARRELKL